MDTIYFFYHSSNFIFELSPALCGQIDLKLGLAYLKKTEFKSILAPTLEVENHVINDINNRKEKGNKSNFDEYNEIVQPRYLCVIVVVFVVVVVFLVA